MSATVTRIHADLAEPAGRPVLRRSAELDIEAAAGFLVELDARMEDATVPRLAYLIGLAEAHLVSMIELAREAVAR